MPGGQRNEKAPFTALLVVQVDAALDLSHTQNIGKLISDRFPSAQFLIVSLKEGMFNNANVLFRTHFVNGASTVQRTARSGTARSSRKTGDEDNGQPKPVKKGRTEKTCQENRSLANA